MRKFLEFFILFVFVSFTTVTAQKSAIYTNDLKEYHKAVAMYKDGHYASSQIIFEKVFQETSNDELKSDCLYYDASCAIKLNHANGSELMQRFLDVYPTNAKSNMAYLELAYCYFDEKNYSNALNYFNKVEEYQIKYEDRDKFNFEKGYCLFNSKNKKGASEYLNKVLKSKTYGDQANYYLGFIAYEGNDYSQANKYFDEVSDDEKYKEKLSYFQADMNFKQGNFQKAIELGQKAMAKSTAAEKSELNKIIGESYFNLQLYDKSIPFLKAYKGKRGRWNNTDYYQLGYAYYKQNDLESAISQFNKIIGGKDSVAQNAYYHLGESYLTLNKKQEALNAFKNASEMNYDLAIQEDASLNYAKLSYEIGNSYQSVPNVLLSFINKYPNNPNRSTIERLLIDSYISSKNYEEALVLLEKNKSPENKLAFQKVTFYRGLELYTDRNYQEALKMFKKSLSSQVDAQYTARSVFWKGETEYVLEDYKDALLSYKQFVGLSGASQTDEYTNINYNIAYAYFKQKEYDPAGDYFQNQIEKTKLDKIRLNDSYIRLGDCRFVNSKYYPAMDAYNKVIEFNSIDADYAAFQKALCYGFVGKNDKKIDDLNSFISSYSKSSYKDDAMFELANTYVATNKQDLGLKTYDRLITEIKKSSFTSKAILRQGLVYYNSDSDDLALAKFKKVVADYPKSPEALQAVATARLIYVDNGKVDEYANWVRTLGFVTVSDSELDNDSYEAAFKQFEQKNNNQAISSFNAYLSSFPRGLHSLQANFYLAQIYYSEGLFDKSVSNYEYVVNQTRNEFSEQSLTRLGQIYLKDTNKSKAIPVLQRLENEAELAQNRIFAQSNLMKCYYDDKDYSNSVIYAEKVLNSPKIDDNVKSDAQIIIARSAIQTGDETKARMGYAKLLTIAKGELAAETLYYDAYFKNKDGKYEASNTAVQKLAKSYSSYRYYGAKGLIVMAKNFYGLKDSFQATYILDNVIKNFTDFQDVVAEAKSELNSIKSEESKTNSSITN